jgi:hypothetical protein
MKTIEVVWDHQTRQLWINEGARLLVHVYGVDAFHFRERFKNVEKVEIFPDADVLELPKLP